MPEGKKGGIPEKIKLGDVEYVVADHPEILAMLQSVRKEEKDKLYSQISTLEANKKALEDEKKTAGGLSETQKAELQTLKDELAVVKAEKKKLEDADDGTEPKKKKDEPTTKGLTQAEVQSMMEEALSKRDAKHQEELDKVRNGLNTKNISDYRKEQLAKYDGVIIADFVPNSLKSEEEVNSAIATALEKSKNYIHKDYELEDGKKQRMSLAEYEAHELEAKEKAKGGNPTPDYVPNTPPQKPNGGSGDLDGKELLSRIDQMSAEEYAKHHEQIKKEVSQIQYKDN